MTYLDTGCFVKLYYPEPDSAKVIAQIQGKPICYAPLHEFEFMSALHDWLPISGCLALRSREGAGRK